MNMVVSGYLIRFGVVVNGVEYTPESIKEEQLKALVDSGGIVDFRVDDIGVWVTKERISDNPIHK